MMIGDYKRHNITIKLTTYPFGTNTFKVCESEMQSKIKMIIFDNYVNETKNNII